MYRMVKVIRYAESRIGRPMYRTYRLYRLIRGRGCMRDRRVRRPTSAALRAMGLTPGLMAYCCTTDGCARLEQLAPERWERRQQFAQSLADAMLARGGQDVCLKAREDVA